jgi:LemA protein
MDMTWLIFCAVLALAMFWAVGAHHRLVRMRAEILRQWHLVDTVWLQVLVRLESALGAHALQQTPEGQDTDLQQRCDELLGALSQARVQPMNADIMATVSQAHAQLMLTLSQQMKQGQASDWHSLAAVLVRMKQMLPATLATYHVAVQTYNQAIDVWPVRPLARQLGFGPAMRLELKAGPMELA